MTQDEIIDRIARLLHQSWCPASDACIFGKDDRKLARQTVERRIRETAREVSK